MSASQNTSFQENICFKRPTNGTSIPGILELGGMLGKATEHKKGYIQIPADDAGHEALLQIIDSAQWTINRGMGEIGFALAVGDDANDYLQDLGWLLNGLADQHTQLTNAKEQIEESQWHLSDNGGL